MGELITNEDIIMGENDWGMISKMYESVLESFKIVSFFSFWGLQKFYF